MPQNARNLTIVNLQRGDYALSLISFVLFFFLLLLVCFLLIDIYAYNCLNTAHFSIAD